MGARQRRRSRKYDAAADDDVNADAQQGEG
jgi:hypothetical protein